MKVLLLLLLLVTAAGSIAQIPKSGFYIYNYCDEEYNKCIGKCKIKIEGNKIWVYAPANLTGIREGELFEHETLVKHRSGKWFIIYSSKEKNIKTIGGCDGGIAWFDFKRKRFWTC